MDDMMNSGNYNCNNQKVNTQSNVLPYTFKLA